MKARIFLMFLMFALPITVFSQNRNVIWVHGLDGDHTSWEYYANIFTAERKINSTRQHYPGTTVNLATAANQLRPSVPGNASTNMGIGHSMGGVMIREVDRMPEANNSAAPKKFGGYITVASPNYGAPVSDNILKNNVHSAAATALDRLTCGPLAQSPVFTLPWTIVSGWHTTKVANLFLEGVGFLSQTTNQDLKEGSQPMNYLNENPSYVPVNNRIAIIAEETNPVHWRMISSKLFKEGSSSTPGDDFLPATMIIVRAAYNQKFLEHTASAVINPFFPFFGYHANAAAQWKKGQDWIDDSENIWCTLIKTSRQEIYTYWAEVWEPCPPNPKPIPDCGEWVWKQLTGVRTVTYKNDGLLPVYAQELKGVTGSNRYVIDHANHFEIRNMRYSKKNGTLNDGTKNVLNDIFNRQNDWFTTPRK